MTKAPVIIWKDFLDASRSRMLWAIMSILVLLVTIVYIAIWWVGTDPEVMDIIGPASALMQLIVPLLGLIVGYRAIVSERQSGSIKVLLSLPPSRGDVIVGKFIGRALVLAVAIFAAFLAFIVLALVLFQELPLVDFVAIAASSAIVGFAFVGIAVGVSGLVNTRGQAMAGVIGLYLVFLLFWDLITAGIHRLVMGELPAGPAGQFEAWYILLQWLNPIEAYGVVSDAILEESFGAFTIPLFAPQELSNTEAIVIGEVPAYLSDPVAVLILLLWAIIPVVIGWYRFDRVDLG